MVNLPRHWLIALTIVGVMVLVGAFAVGSLVFDSDSQDDLQEDAPEQFVSVTTQGPFISIEPPSTRAMIGVGTPIRIRVEDVTGIEAVSVSLGNEVVFVPTVHSGQRTVYATYPWVPETTGNKRFRVQAETVDGRRQESSFTIPVSCCPPQVDINISYVVQAEDRPIDIAQEFGVCFETLLLMNPGLAQIAPGDVLTIPYRPDVEGAAGSINPDEDCGTAPSNFFENPDVRQSIPRRDLVFPVTQPYEIGRQFGCSEFYTGYRGTNCPDNQPWFHTGLDIALQQGAPITSIDGGLVTYAGPDVTSNANCAGLPGSDPPHNGYGRHVRVEKGNIAIIYGHMSGIIVPPGTQLDGHGYLLGYAGSTGCSTATHLHLEMRYNNRAIDPEIYIGFVENILEELENGGSQN